MNFLESDRMEIRELMLSKGLPSDKANEIYNSLAKYVEEKKTLSDKRKDTEFGISYTEKNVQEAIKELLIFIDRDWGNEDWCMKRGVGRLNHSVLVIRAKEIFGERLL